MQLQRPILPQKHLQNANGRLIVLLYFLSFFFVWMWKWSGLYTWLWELWYTISPTLHKGIFQRLNRRMHGRGLDITFTTPHPKRLIFNQPPISCHIASQLSKQTNNHQVSPCPVFYHISYAITSSTIPIFFINYNNLRNKYLVYFHFC